MMFDYKPQDSRPARNGWAPGKYLCTCYNCEKRFLGHKWAYECADCAYEDPEPKDLSQ